MFRTLTGLTMVAFLVLNLAMVTIPSVYNLVSSIVWGAVSLVADASAAREATVAKTRAEIEADRVRERELRAQVDRSKDRQQAIELDLDETRRREAVALEENVELNAEKSRLDRELTEAKSRLTSIESDLDASRRTEAEAARRAAEATSENARLSNELSQANSKLRWAEVELDAARRQEAALLQRNQTLTSGNARLRGDLQTAQIEFDMQARRERRAEVEVAETITRMQARSLRMVSRNTATIFADSLPVVGVLTVIGGAAWDIYDTCEQLSDLKLIRKSLDGSAEESESKAQWCGLSHGEILAMLLPGTSGQERKCIEARWSTETLYPPECEGITMVDDGGFPDPLDAPPEPMPEGQPMDF